MQPYSPKSSSCMSDVKVMFSKSWLMSWKVSISLSSMVYASVTCVSMWDGTFQSSGVFVVLLSSLLVR